MKLACLLLFLNNLKLPSNFRGIQMLSSISALYERVITRRLDQWITIHDEQTGKKGKSTLTQLFTVRILIEMVKKTNKTLYVGCFDIEKAYDKVSRLLLLKKLIKCGIGHIMLNALKAIYTITSCVLVLGDKMSTAFCTTCGIRQGAPSSSNLFMLFVHDLIDYIQQRCINEPVIDNMHTLLHMDDTLILSTQRSLFEMKCNLMLDYFEENKLKLNLGKSGFLFINGNNMDVKEPIMLKNGLLSYKSEITYLGLIFSDAGSMKKDMKLNMENKRANVTIKFTNFCAKNFLAPIKVKLDVLDSCVLSSLWYGCETWGESSLDELDVIHRIGLKTALSVRNSTCNEITYIKADAYPIVGAKMGVS